MRMIVTRRWIIKLRFLCKGTHCILFQGIKLPITTCLQEHGISSARGNLIRLSVYSRKYIWERGCIEEIVYWTLAHVLSSGPVFHIKVYVGFVVYSGFEYSNYCLHKWLSSGRYYKWGPILHWTSQGFQEWQRTMWCCSKVKENTIWSIKNRMLLVWKVAKWFVKS